jgi:hypothetical protein
LRRLGVDDIGGRGGGCHGVGLLGGLDAGAREDC